MSVFGQGSFLPRALSQHFSGSLNGVGNHTHAKTRTEVELDAASHAAMLQRYMLDLGL